MVQMARGADAILKRKQPQRPQSAGQKLRYITDKAKLRKFIRNEDHYYNFASI